MKYQIEECALYEVEAETAQKALEKLKQELTCPFPTEVTYRDVYDQAGNLCEAEDY